MMNQSPTTPRAMPNKTSKSPAPIFDSTVRRGVFFTTGSLIFQPARGSWAANVLELENACIELAPQDTIVPQL
jgi:hypothetical protein